MQGALFPAWQGMIFNELRSKTKTFDQVMGMDPTAYPDWSYDGSSTGQAEGGNSDCILRPVCVRADPIRGAPNVLVMCEVFSPDGTPHPSNTRAKLRDVADASVMEQEPWFGFEQVKHLGTLRSLGYSTTTLTLHFTSLYCAGVHHDPERNWKSVRLACIRIPCTPGAIS